MFLFAQKLWPGQAISPAKSLGNLRAMARPVKPDPERKSTRLATRLTPAERLQIEQAAHKAGKSTSEYLRQQALTGKITVYEHRPIDSQTFDQIRRIGVNLNQLTRLAHERGELPSELESVCSTVEAILIREIGSRPEPEIEDELADDS